jgi:predicted regulator of Ras-like GTPase activity (Roadblock/LC7/MglB family)
VKLRTFVNQSLMHHRKGVTVTVALEQDLRAEIAGLRARLPDVTGALVATVDGMLIVHETDGLQAETLAAMSAAQLGLGRQFATTAMQGDFREAVTRSANGCLAVFAAGSDALLTVFATAQLNVGRLYHEARPVAVRVATLLADSATSIGR